MYTFTIYAPLDYAKFLFRVIINFSFTAPTQHLAKHKKFALLTFLNRSKSVYLSAAKNDLIVTSLHNHFFFAVSSVGFICDAVLYLWLSYTYV